MLSNEVYNQALAQGYSPEQIQQAYSELQKEEGGSSGSKPSYFSGRNEENLIKWQLEIESLLERIEHMLRGDILTINDGNIIWKSAEDGGFLNESGVGEIMRVLAMYINRNTILSNYSEEVINDKMYDFGCELNDLIYCRYEGMGLDSYDKRKAYPMMVREIIDAVHSTYLRALNGGERDSLREARMVNQNDNGGGFGVNPMMPYQKRSVLNPLRWIGGKYKQ